MPTFVKDNDTFKQAQEILVKDGGVWKSCQDVYVNDNGTWKSVLYEAGSQDYTTAQTVDFVVPAGVFTINYTIYGAGAGSGACNNNGDAWVGGGGGAGGKLVGSIAVTPSETLSIVVGNKGYGASARFNTWYSYNPNNSTLGTGTDGQPTLIKRGATVLAQANGGGRGAQYSYGVGGTPKVSGTAPTYSHNQSGDINGNGQTGSGPEFPNRSYGFTGHVVGGTNGSGTPPSNNSSSRGTGYGNGGGQVGITVGTDGQDGAILLTW